MASGPSRRSRRAKQQQRTRSDNRSASHGVVYFGIGGGSFLACAIFAMILWMFLRRQPESPAVEPGIAAEQSEPVSPVDSPPPGIEEPAVAAAGPPESTSTSPDESDESADSSPAPAKETDPLQPFLRVELESPAQAFAFDSELGCLAVIGAWSNAIGVLTREQLADGAQFEDIATVELQGTPVVATHKPLEDGGVFVIGQRQPDAIILIDPNSLASTATIELTSGAPIEIAGSSNPLISTIYVATEAADGKQSMSRVDLKREATITEWGETNLRDFAVSFDGESVYCRVEGRGPGRGPLRPTTSSEFNWSEDPTHPYQEDDWRYLVGPRGRFVVSGTKVVSPDFRTEQPELGFEPSAFLSNQPWAAGIDDWDFVVGSINDGRVVRRFPLPEDWHQVTRANERQQARSGRDSWLKLLGGDVFADGSHEQFVLCTSQRILVFPFDRLDLPDEPLLFLTDRQPDSVVVGGPQEFSLTRASADTSVEPVDLPSGAEIDGEVIRWTPGADQIGSHEFVVRLTAGDLARETRWIVDVHHQTLPVTFLVRGVDVSSDEQRLVAWGHDWPTQPPSRQDIARGFVTAPWRLAVIELENMEVISEGPLDVVIGQAEFCDEEIVVTTDGPDGMRLLRVAAEDCRIVGETAAPAGRIKCIADRVLALRAYGETIQNQWKYFTLPDLEPRDPTGKLPPIDFDPKSYVIEHDARRLSDGWLLDGVVWDEELSEPSLLIAPDGLMHGVLSSPPHQTTINCEQLLVGYLCSVPPGPLSHLMRSARPGDGNRDLLPYSSHVPARIGFHHQRGDVFFDLLALGSEDRLQSIRLDDTSVAPNYPYRDRGDATWDTTPDRAIVARVGKTYVLPIDPIPAPFRIEPRQSELELSVRAPTNLEYLAEDAVRFELHIPSLSTRDDRFQYESEDGRFRVEISDLNALSKAIWDRAAPNKPGESSTDDMAARMQQTGETYRKLTGRRARGVPVYVDAFVRATHENGEVAVLKHAYVVVIPMPLFMKHKP